MMRHMNWVHRALVLASCVAVMFKLLGMIVVDIGAVQIYSKSCLK